MTPAQRSMDNMPASDMAIPEIKLVQATGGADAKSYGANPGDFYNSITGEVIAGNEGVNIAIVDITKTRTYWGRDELGEDPPKCASQDSVVNLNNQPCEPCPLGVRNDTPWLLSRDERRKACTVNYNLLAIDAHMMPCRIRASGISTQSVRELISMLKLNRQLKGEYHRAKINMTSIARKSPSGESFAMKFRLDSLITNEPIVQELKMLSDQLLGSAAPALPEGVTEEQVAIPAVAESKAIEPKVETPPVAESKILAKEVQKQQTKKAEASKINVEF